MEKVKAKNKTPGGEMVRVKITKKIEKKAIEYHGETIELIPELTIVQQLFLINNYINDYFTTSGEGLAKEHQYRLIEAEYNLTSHVYFFLTNIDSSADKKTGINTVLGDVALWEIITTQIENYNDFRKKLDTIVEDIKAQKSLPSKISSLIEKAELFIIKMGEMSPEFIAESQKSLEGMVQKLEESSVLGKVTSDLQKEGQE